MQYGFFLVSCIIGTTHSNLFHCICNLKPRQLSFSLFRFALIFYYYFRNFCLKGVFWVVPDCDFFIYHSSPMTVKISCRFILVLSFWSSIGCRSLLEKLFHIILISLSMPNFFLTTIK